MKRVETSKNLTYKLKYNYFRSILSGIFLNSDFLRRLDSINLISDPKRPRLISQLNIVLIHSYVQCSSTSIHHYEIHLKYGFSFILKFSDTSISISIWELFALKIWYTECLSWELWLCHVTYLIFSRNKPNLLFFKWNILYISRL